MSKREADKALGRRLQREAQFRAMGLPPNAGGPDEADMSDHEDEAQALRAVELERMDAAWIRPDPEADAAVDRMLGGLPNARDCRHGHLARSCGLCEYDRLADAARALLDAVVWRSDGPDVPESVDLRGVTAEMIRDLEDALL